MKKLLRQLTKITDLTILFAAIFVFLAYITPEGISESSINNLRTNSQTIASSLSSAAVSYTHLTLPTIYSV